MCPYNQYEFWIASNGGIVIRINQYHQKGHKVGIGGYRFMI
jgi:hypothetical protein